MNDEQRALLEELRRAMAAAQAAAVAKTREASDAVDTARKHRRRSRLLRAFVHPLHLSRDTKIVRCAWCDRIHVGGEWVDAAQFLQGELPARLADHASHGICPDCLAHVNDEAARQRR